MTDSPGLEKRETRATRRQPIGMFGVPSLRDSGVFFTPTQR